MKTFVLIVFSACLAQGERCLPVVGGDRILARDLALAVPAFASVPATRIIGYMPAPGTKRNFAEAELLRLARANHVALTKGVEVCFEIPMHPLDENAVRTSMRLALPADADLSILETPAMSVPAGALEFPLSGLEPPAQNGRIWRGSVRYGETLRMKIWARVSVERRVAAVVAASDLALNTPIEARHVRLGIASAPLDPDVRLAIRLEDVLGRAPRKSIAAGSPIPLSILDIPPSVHRGDAVKVEVQSGPARIRIDAIAEGAARAGDMVELRNPMTGRTFRARLGENSRAVIVVAGRQSL
jgi:flagella basal body P-ring formation protein FlgA